MRSRTPALLPRRCKACTLQRPLCICAQMPWVQTQTRYVIVRHQLEAWKTTGTARLAARAMANAWIYDFGVPGWPLPPDLLTGPDTWLLFPSPSAVTPGSDRWPPRPAPKTVVLVDGTWVQARRMTQRIPALQAMPRIGVPPRRADRARLREAPDAGMASLEALAACVRQLDDPAAGEALDALFDRFVEAVRVQKISGGFTGQG